MARATRSRATVATAPEAVTAEATPPKVTKPAARTKGTLTKAENQEAKADSKPASKQRRALRQKQRKKAHRHQAIKELHKTLLESAGSSNSISKAGRAAIRAQVYQPHRIRAKTAAKKVPELERLVRRQQEEITELRRLAGGIGIPKLQPPAGSTPPPPADGAGPDSSPAKIRDQLAADAAQVGTTAVEVEEVVVTGQAGGEPMEGVQETHVVTSVEQDIEYPALPSVEDTTQVTDEVRGGEGQEAAAEAEDTAAPNPPAVKLAAADTPIKSKEDEVRHSSAEDSNAGTPSNVRRSPRKKAPAAKRRSFAGHSYVG